MVGAATASPPERAPSVPRKRPGPRRCWWWDEFSARSPARSAASGTRWFRRAGPTMSASRCPGGLPASRLPGGSPRRPAVRTGGGRFPRADREPGTVIDVHVLGRRRRCPGCSSSPSRSRSLVDGRRAARRRCERPSTSDGARDLSEGLFSAAVGAPVSGDVSDGAGGDARQQTVPPRPVRACRVRVDDRGWLCGKWCVRVP